MMSWLGPWLNNETKDITNGDIAVALGGGRDRQLAAVNAVLNKQAKAVWVTGPELDLGLVPEEGDYFLYHASPEASTWTDAEDTLRRASPIEPIKLIIYTSDYHIRRAQTIFSLVAANTFRKTFNIQWKAVPNSMFKLEDWYKTAQGRQIVMNEYFGIMSALIKRKK